MNHVNQPKIPNNPNEPKNTNQPYNPKNRNILYTPNDPLTVCDNPLVFKRKSIERMRIAVEGNVGIGTPSPAAKLDVKGGHIAINENMLRLRGGADANHGMLYSPAI